MSGEWEEYQEERKDNAKVDKRAMKNKKKREENCEQDIVKLRHQNRIYKNVQRSRGCQMRNSACHFCAFKLYYSGCLSVDFSEDG